MLSFFLFLLVAAASTINIYGRELGTESEVAIGQIRYDSETKAALFDPVTSNGLGRQLCLGTHELPNHKCFVYHEQANGSLQGKFQLFMDGNDIVRLSFSASTGDLSVEVIETTYGPAPNLQPVAVESTSAQQPLQTKTVVRKRIVKNENGEESEVEEQVTEVTEVDNRSWVQKNWMYIVPPLVLFLIVAPGDTPAEK